MRLGNRQATGTQPAPRPLPLHRRGEGRAIRPTQWPIALRIILLPALLLALVSSHAPAGTASRTNLIAAILSEDTAAQIDLVKNLAESGDPLVEQHLDFCLDVGDIFSIMDRGSIVASGPIHQLSDDIVKQHLTV